MNDQKLTPLLGYNDLPSLKHLNNIPEVLSVKSAKGIITTRGNVIPIHI